MLTTWKWRKGKKAYELYSPLIWIIDIATWFLKFLNHVIFWGTKIYFLICKIQKKITSHVLPSNIKNWTLLISLQAFVYSTVSSIAYCVSTLTIDDFSVCSVFIYLKYCLDFCSCVLFYRSAFLLFCLFWIDIVLFISLLYIFSPLAWK